MRLGRYLSSCAFALIGLILIYTLFGYALVNLHAAQLAAEMRLLQLHGLPALIVPHDHFLTSFSARLGSATLFGLTLGCPAALFLSLWAYPAWRRGRLERRDIGLGLALVALLSYLTFSAELVWLAPLSAGLATGLFWQIVRRVPAQRSALAVKPRQLGLMLALILLPPLLLASTAFFAVRDLMLTSPVLSHLNRFYYEHTLLAADVIKPASERSPLVIALDAAAAPISRGPVGSLTILGARPDQVVGARVILDQQPPGVDLTAAVQAYSAAHDYNRLLRQGVGLGLASLKLVLLALAVWLSLGLLRLWSGRPLAVCGLLLVYYALFWPLAQVKVYEAALDLWPAGLPAYAVAASEPKRYLAAARPELDAAALARLIQDDSARVRLTALVNAGQRRARPLLPLMLAALDDPQFNVRTKACWALGRLGEPQAVAALQASLSRDESWYVRDYAWAALNRLKPVVRVVAPQ